MTRFGSVLLAAVVLTALLYGCGGDDGAGASGATFGKRVAVGSGAFTRLAPDELAKMLQAKDFPLINVHIPYEGELAGTDEFVAFDEITKQLDKLPADRSAKVVLYCRSGNMSTDAAQELVRLGYTNVWELGGGMVAWAKAGRTVEQRAR